MQITNLKKYRYDKCVYLFTDVLVCLYTHKNTIFINHISSLIKSGK